MFGKDAQTAKVQKLVEKKAQLEAALPVVDDSRAIAIEARLDKIETAIAREVARAKAIGNAAAIKAALGVDGIGGLEFTAMAPPGVGRLVRLPFYPTTAVPAGYTSGGGAAAASNTVPTISFTLAHAGTYPGQPASFTVVTPQISWATLRIVGFEADIHNASVDLGQVNAGGLVAGEVTNSTPMPKLVVSDLQIGGGANLFTHEDFGDAEIYDSTQPEFCGLRDYPILKSPNTASVSCGVLLTSAAAAATTNGSTNITFSLSLLCEVLQDDNYGSHIPGPYARKGAMVRRGGSFV